MPPIRTITNFQLYLERSWTWASRGKVGDDPVLFAIKDHISRLCVALVLLIMGAARLIETPGLTP